VQLKKGAAKVDRGEYFLCFDFEFLKMTFVSKCSVIKVYFCYVCKYCLTKITSQRVVLETLNVQNVTYLRMEGILLLIRRYYSCRYKESSKYEWCSQSTVVWT
jgi:hypothetical protein